MMTTGMDYKHPSLSEKVEFEDWGVAMCVRGKLKGCLVEYDDDETDKMAIVYKIGSDCAPDILGGYFTVPRSSLRRIKD